MTPQFSSADFANGLYALDRFKRYRVEAAQTVFNEDWKTASAHKQRAIKAGEIGTMGPPVNNFYGTWAYVRFDDVDFGVYTSFSSLNLLGEIERHP